MGRVVSVHCEGCGLPPTDLVEGRGRMATLFQPAPGFCHHCNTPQTLEVVAPCVDLRALRDGVEPSSVELPKDRTELLSLIVRLRERRAAGAAARPHADWTSRRRQASRGEEPGRPPVRSVRRTR